jgi:FMN phosphatase YigB (HAD superfamily)
MIKNYLFDLDGTLLFLDEEKFINTYIKHIAYKFHSLGLNSEEMVKRLWAGTKEMVKNDGSMMNEEKFWTTFYPESKENQDLLKKQLEDFYRHEFDIVRETTKTTETAKKIIDHLKKHQKKIFLLTNPIFPKVATYKRLKWAGLDPDDFVFITTYENSMYAKPNPKYYQWILDKFNLKEEETIMVGNDVDEDMIVEDLGVETYLVTDCLNNKNNKDMSGFKQGKLEDFYQIIVN